MSYETHVLVELVKNESNTDEVISQILSDLQNAKLSILKLIESFGGLLTSEDVSLRRGGVEILMKVLEKLPSSYLNAKELEHLADYFSTCLISHHSFIPSVLRAFLALANMDNFSTGLASKMFTVLNLNLTCQSQPHADRLICYQLLNILMEKKQTELKMLGVDFVYGYLSFIDSESDPRNLMYLFKNLPKFYKRFPPCHLLDDAFDTVSCYFPVDFRTNPNDPRGITREDLSNALMPCLTAIDDFCPSTVELALDKLSSDLKLAKIDASLLLKRSVNVFSIEKLCPLVTQITSALLNELKPGLSYVEVQESCIDVLGCLIKRLSDHEKIDHLNKMLLDVFSNARHFLNDVHLTFFVPTVKFMSKIASSCEIACQFVVTQTLPKLFSFKDAALIADVNKILESFKLILLPCAEFNVNCAELKEVVEIWPNVVEFFLSHCRSENAEIKIPALEGTTCVSNLFSNDQRRTFISLLCDGVKFEKNSIVRQKCVDSLRICSIHFANEVKLVVDEELTFPENGSVVDLDLRKHIFYCWCSLASVPEFLTYLDETVKKYIVDDKCEYADFVIEALKELVEREKNNVHFLHSLHCDVNITKHLMDWWHKGCNAISDDDRGLVFDDERTAENLQLIICIILRGLDENLQLENAVRYLHLTTVHSKRFMSSFQYLNVNEDLSTPKVHCSLSIITFESIVNALLPIVLEKTLNQCLTQICKYLSTLAVYCSRPVCCAVACRSIATMFNKISEGAYLEEQLEYLFAYSTNIIDSEKKALQTNAVNLVLYITKSLLLRGYRDLNQWLDKLLVLMMDEDLSSIVARGFRLLCEEEEYFLNESCHCCVKLFYRQRLFSYVITKLVENMKTVTEEIKIQSAMSVVYLLEKLPQTVISKYFIQIIPILVELLNVNCAADVSLITIQTMMSLLPTNTTIFEEHIETFLPKLLILARNAINMKIRIIALQCLAEYSKLKLSVTITYKTRVIYELAPCIDDRKRLVRKEAVKARTRWLVLGIS